MKMHRILSILSATSPLLRIRFDDGLEGDIDLSPYLNKGGYYEPLRDPAFFAQAAVGRRGRCFGWHLDDIGKEIDFSADGARADIETTMVEARAKTYRRKISQAAE